MRDGSIDEIASAYRRSQILFAASRLGLFEALEKGPLRVDELARSLASDPRGTRILADALTAMGLLEKRSGRYANAQVARNALLPGSPHSQRALLLHEGKLYERWAGLYDAVKSGRPVPDERIDPRLRGDAAEFARAMAEVGRRSAGLTADAADLSQVEVLLDLGGGPGLYALEFARRHPQLKAVVLDRADTVAVAQKNIRNAGLEHRVSARSGDAFEDDLGGPYDAILISNLVHIYSAAKNKRLVGRCAAALAPAGRLLIKDFVLDAEGTSPEAAALFAVNMLVSTEGGGCYTVREIEQWLSAADLDLERVVELTPQSRLVTARRR